MHLHIDDFVIEAKWCWYFGQVIFFAAAIRLVLCVLREWELRTWRGHWWRSVWLAFCSMHPSAQVNDYGAPFFLGLLELAGYPFFIATANWTVIGGWLLFKTAAHWGQWTKSRTTYTRFLLGSALVIAASVWLAQCITVTHLGWADSLRVDFHDPAPNVPRANAHQPGGSRALGQRPTSSRVSSLAADRRPGSSSK